jgi:hypothetical protein
MEKMQQIFVRMVCKVFSKDHKGDAADDGYTGTAKGNIGS